MDELRVLAGAHVGVGQDARTFIMEGKRSRWMRYVRRVVWKAPAVKASSTSTALCLSSTVTCKRLFWKSRGGEMSVSAPTRLSRAYYPIRDTHKLRQRRIDAVDPRQHGDDIRARVRKLLRQHTRKEHAERLPTPHHTSAVLPNTPSAEPGKTNLERVHVRPIAPPLYGAHGPPKEVPRLHVQVQDLGGARLVEDGLERGAVGAQEEELGPEAVRLFGVVALRPGVASVLALKCPRHPFRRAVGRSRVSSGSRGRTCGRVSQRRPATPPSPHQTQRRKTNLEERLVELHNLGLKHLGRRLPRQRRRLHRPTCRLPSTLYSLIVASVRSVGNCKKSQEDALDSASRIATP